MLSLSATCLAIALADKAGTLNLVERPSRMGGTYIAICDDHGIIEVALDQAEADARLAGIRARLA
jgi:hypothetical protein